MLTVLRLDPDIVFEHIWTLAQEPTPDLTGFGRKNIARSNFDYLLKQVEEDAKASVKLSEKGSETV